MRNSDLDKNARMKIGKRVENLMKERLRSELLWKIYSSTENDDKYAKIDGYAIIPDTNYCTPFQLKYRISGNDVLVETVLNWTPDCFYNSEIDWPKYAGRDLRGYSDKTILLSRNGKQLIIIDTKTVKDVAAKLTEDFANYMYGESGADVIGKSTIPYNNSPSEMWKMFHEWQIMHPALQHNRKTKAFAHFKNKYGVAKIQSDVYQKHRWHRQNMFKVVCYISLHGLTEYIKEEGLDAFLTHDLITPITV